MWAADHRPQAVRGVAAGGRRGWGTRAVRRRSWSLPRERSGDDLAGWFVGPHYHAGGGDLAVLSWNLMVLLKVVRERRVGEFA
jgi:hypothetical protein